MSQQTPFISRLTQWLGVRRNKMWLRYKDDISPRTIPQPQLPPTSNAKLSGNYYYTRDQRRKASPPFVISSALASTAPKLEAGTSAECSETPTEVIPENKEVSLDDLPTPGYPTQWTLSSDEPYLRQ